MDCRFCSVNLAGWCPSRTGDKAMAGYSFRVCNNWKIVAYTDEILKSPHNLLRGFRYIELRAVSRVLSSRIVVEQ